jgi:hypothetical protein
MKKVALFLMIVGLAVALVACQGAVGPKGDPGDPGEDGTSGTDGTHGTDGLNALIPAGGTPPVVTWVDDVRMVDGTTVTFEIGATPDPIDLSDHFLGGGGDVTYELEEDSVTSAASGEAYFDVDVEDGTATLTVNEDATLSNFADDGDHLVSFDVIATDEHGQTAEKTFQIKKNEAPTRASATGTAFNVGTHTAENTEGDDDAKALRPNLDEYVITVGVGDGGLFDDADPDSVTIVPSSSDTATATVSADGKTVTVTGVTATEDGETVTISLKAVDAGGLESQVMTYAVTVLATPTADGTIGAQSYDRGNTAIALVQDIDNYFMPSSGLTMTGESSDPNVIGFSATADDHHEGINLMGTPNNTGSATITVTATDTIGQYGTQTFTATVSIGS